MHMHFDYGTEGQRGAVFDDARHAENPFSSNLPNSDRIEYLISDIGLNRSAVKRRLGSTKYVVMRSCGQRG